MEQPNNIDQHFRERLQGAEVPPPSFVWPNVERELRQRRRRLFLWLWLGLGVTGAGGWALWSAMPPAVIPTVAAAPTTEEIRTTGMGSTATREDDHARISPADESNLLSADKNLAKGTKRSKGTPTSSGARQWYALPHASRDTTTGNLSPLAGGKQSSTSFLAENLLPAPLEVAPLPPAAYALLTNQDAPTLILPKTKPFIFKKKAPKNCYNFGPHARVWLFDAYAGPSLPQRQLTAARPEYENYLGQRRNTEQADWAFNAGLRASLLFERHFLLRTGLHYEQMTEKFEYADPDFVKVTITQTTKIIDNVPVTVIDTIGIEYGEHFVKTYNRYGQLDVPLMAGVEFRSGRAGLSLQAGAALNIYFWKRGTVLNTLGKPTPFTPDAATSTPVFRQRAGWSTTASAQLFYHLRSRVRIFAEPYCRHSLRPLTLDGQPVSQRYTTWGLKFGLTKIFD